MSKSFGSIIVRNIKTVFGDNFDNLELVTTTFVNDTHTGIMPVSFSNFEDGDYATLVTGRLISEEHYQRYIAINYWMEARREITVWIPQGGEDFSIALFKQKRPV